MLRLKTVEVPAQPATTKEVVDYVACDFCGGVVPERRDGNQQEYERVELEFSEGSVYPSGGSERTTKFDCCAECWKVKILPALSALGAKPRTEDLDW